MCTDPLGVGGVGGGSQDRALGQTPLGWSLLCLCGAPTNAAPSVLITGGHVTPCTRHWEGHLPATRKALPVHPLLTHVDKQRSYRPASTTGLDPSTPALCLTARPQPPQGSS